MESSRSHERSTRRDFLKTSAVLTGSAAAGLSLVRGAHGAGAEELKIGMIGSGSRCSGAAAQCMAADKSVKLVAMCDVFDSHIQGKRKALTTQFPDQVAVDDDHCFVGFDGYRKVIDSCDLVLIACASKFHPMYSEAAIKAGKHVFVEKPHAIDPVGVRRMEKACELAKKKNLSVMSGLQSRWDPGWQEIMKRIHDGAIGKIIATQSMFLRPPYRVYEHPEGMSEIEYHFWNWYHFRWLSGDDVPQSLVHNVDRMSWALQGKMPKWAFAVAGRSGSFGIKFGDMFDHSCVVYEYEDGTRVYALCRTTTGCYNNSSDIIMGSKGTCHLGAKRLVDLSGNEMYKYDGPRMSPYQVEQDELVKSIKEGKPFNAGDYMNKSTMIGVLGQIVSYQGNAVSWDEAYNAELQYGPAPEEASFDMEPPTVPDETGNYPIPIVGKTRFLK